MQGGWAGGLGGCPSEPHLRQLSDHSTLQLHREPQREALRCASCLLEAERENSRSRVSGSSGCRVKQQTFTHKWTLRMSVRHIKVQKCIILTILHPEQIKSGLACFALTYSAKQCRNTWGAFWKDF